MFRFLHSRESKDALRIVLSITIVACAVLLVSVMGGSQRVRVERSETKTIVEVMRAVTHRGDFDFEIDGVVVPFREIDMAAEVAGRVTYKSPACRAGEPVREGDLLFRIDKTEYQLEVDRLAELVEQAVGSREELADELKSAGEQIQLAEKELEIRERELARYQNSTAFSEAEKDMAERNRLMSDTTLQTRKDQQQLLTTRKRRLTSLEASARTQLAKAELDLARCDVRSRITGVIVTESVQQESFVQKGGVLIVIRDTSKMEIRCNLQMQQMQWLWESAARDGASDGASNPQPEEPSAAGSGQPTTTRTQRAYRFPTTSATVLYELNGVSYAWEAQLTRYANSSVDSRTRMLPCIAEVMDPEKVVRHVDDSITDSAPPTLLSGMFVSLQVRVALPRDLIKLPVTAVGPAGDVWLVDEQKLLRRTRGKVLQSDKESVLVEQTLALKDALIVTSPLANPIEGSLVAFAGMGPESGPDVAQKDEDPLKRGSPTSAPASPDQPAAITPPKPASNLSPSEGTS